MASLLNESITTTPSLVAIDAADARAGAVDVMAGMICSSFSVLRLCRLSGGRRERRNGRACDDGQRQQKDET